MRLMKLLGVACAALAPVAVPVKAADLPPRVPSVTGPVSAPPLFSWTGFYIGAHGGGAWGTSAWSDPFSALADSVSSTGFLAGGQVGFNYQLGNVVFGVEGDASWTNLNGSSTDAAGDVHNTQVDWTSTIAGRLGWALDRWLVYGKGGVAFAHDNSTLTDPFGNTATGVTTRVGWIAGAGTEYALGQNWSARVEYSFLGFPAQNVALTGPVLGTGTANIDLTVQQVKAGLNFHF
jgi:outer membrane immunogenic protein